ncbi:hypothetical protein CS063_05430 [Sporanaerobium hydrogeniformans]|uniref:Uncharacterized protein n=1 Tax=Sporanaerobium hydrogeniformans TaxID=3072179 RepID=A0AC61DEC1_9FIRM|nr:hypothetical protein [Sporanaerobium hydrogeniformans]PHV71490.1 hypothetical protein CS063_05430 [Sporanaerobium hydrogeniformans]
MGEVKRKRPWEDKPKEEPTTFANDLLNQILICTVIGIGAFLVLNTKESTKWKDTFQQEISKNIEIEDLQKWVKKGREVIRDYTLK